MIPLMRNTFYQERTTKKELARFVAEATRLSMGAKCSEFETAFAKFIRKPIQVFLTHLIDHYPHNQTRALPILIGRLGPCDATLEKRKQANNQYLPHVMITLETLRYAINFLMMITVS